ncbi:MAG: hypothetical protein FRX48_08281 [Lasallia pustulata]|uniref:Uncharacterized protein n=1 Tax=Lasallia pustulata TaxID=136370 RepID=A0A5M8PGB1_9LECA|nr:MAG: hypothetical protein FRX48_08281 [Lasallia pustulata]
MPVVLDVLHALQACMSAYALYLSYVSITDSRKYEEKTKKAAQYSNTAKQQLHKTRTTLASGTAAAFHSFLTSINLLCLTSNPTWPKLIFNVLNIVTTLSARAHVSNFWRAKAKVPFVDHYNEAITKTNRLKIQLAYLAGTWAISSAIGLWALL